MTDEDSPSERLRAVAEGFSGAVANLTRQRNLTGAVAAQGVAEELMAIADEIEALPSATDSPAAPLCGQTQPGATGAPCDRPAGHRPKADHSWEVGRQRRIVKEYEPEAKAAPRLRTQVATLTTKLGKATKAVKALELEQLAMRASRGTKAKRRAAERG